MHSFAERGTLHELLLKGCPRERVMGEYRTTKETNSWHGASFLGVSLLGTWIFSRLCTLNYFCENSCRQEPMTSHCLLPSHTSPPNSQSFLLYSVFFCQSKSNILRYLKPVLFINCHLTSRKFPIVMLNFGLTPITRAGVSPMRTLVYHYTMVCLPLLPPCLEQNIFAV